MMLQLLNRSSVISFTISVASRPSHSGRERGGEKEDLLYLILHFLCSVKSVRGGQNEDEGRGTGKERTDRSLVHYVT